MGLLDALIDAYKSGMGLVAPNKADVDMRSNLPGLLADFTPVVGDAKSVYDGIQAAREGDYLGAGLGALGALPFVPAMGGAIRFSDVKSNISPEKLAGFLNKSKNKELRGLVDSDGNVHMWDAYLATHADAAKEAALNYDHKKRFWVKSVDGKPFMDFDYMDLSPSSFNRYFDESILFDGKSNGVIDGKEYRGILGL